MQFTKTTISAILGLLSLIVLITMTYYTNPIFLDKVLLCSSILAMIFFVKIVGEGSGYKKDAK